MLNFKRRKICKLRDLPAEGLVSDPVTEAVPPAENAHSSSILLASVSPTVFIGEFIFVVQGMSDCLS